MSYLFGKQKQSFKEVKNYIDVKYNDKEKAKQLGAKWDKDIKCWYITTDVDEFIKQFNMKTDDDLIKEYTKRIDYCLDAIRHNNNEDITIPDYSYQKKLKNEIDELQNKIDELRKKYIK